MDIGSILILLALTILVGLFVARPILEHKSSSVSQEEQELSTLLAERDRTLLALQELDFDYSLGKIPEEDYPIQRWRMLDYGADILRKLDHLQPAIRSTQTAMNAEDRLEQAIAERRAQADAVLKTAPAAQLEAVAMPGGAAVKKGNGASSAAPDDKLEVLIAERRRSRQGKAAGFCHQCGSPVQQSDSFCPRCGVKTS
jgi:septum formation topological specificity factor MinE